MYNKKVVKIQEVTINDLSNKVDKLTTIVAEGFKSTQADVKSIQVDLSSTHNDIEKLAIFTAKGFDKVDKKLDQHDKIFEIMIKELRDIHQDNKHFRESVSGLNNDGVFCKRKIENLTVRVEKLELN